MSRRYAFLVIALAVIAAGAAVLRQAMSGSSVELAPATSHSVAAPAHENFASVSETMPVMVPATVAAWVPASAAARDAGTEQHASATPLPELLPTMELTSGRLGRQRVAAMEDVGDVYRLAWHAPSRTLFMAVTEKDRMRGIWKLAADGSVKRVIEFNRLDGDFSVSALKSGTLLAQFENPGRVYRSEDAGATWNPVLYDTSMCWNFSDDGHGLVLGGIHAVNQAMLLRSDDDGVTWTEWKDFQRIFPGEAVTYAAGDDRYRLRHLHQVALVGQRIFVGVGDVFRGTLVSEDDGATWRKAWDEGFTGHAVNDLGTKLLLTPDTLRRFGLATFDAATGILKDVWRPGDYNYSGYSYSALFKDGVYYAAFHTETNEVAVVMPKFGVVVSPDGERWYRFLEYGPLTNLAFTSLYLADGGDRVYLSVNGSLYAFKPLDAEWFAFHQPFPKP